MTSQPIIFYLSTCSTCSRILSGIDDPDKFILQDIKTNPINEDQLDYMKSLSGSYEKLFSKRAMKYRALGLHEIQLTEDDRRTWILKEYTFLSRPVAIIDDQIFIGSSKSTIEAFYALANR